MGLVKRFKMGVFPVNEGVLVRGRNHYDVAIKKTNGNILLDKGNIKFISRLPIVFVRGIISAVENSILWGKMLLYAGNYFDTEEKSEADTEVLTREEYLNKQDRISAENSQNWLLFALVMIGLIVATIMFFVIPIYIAGAFFNNINEDQWLKFNIVKYASRVGMMLFLFGAFRLSGGIFKKIRQYNTAAKKTINCFESGQELTLENVKSSSAFHPRSLTYILFLTTVLYSLANVFLRFDNLLLALLIKLLIGIASINVAFEISRLFGMFNGMFSKVLAMICGMWVECFSITEPDDMQIYIAIAGVDNAMIEED